MFGRSTIGVALFLAGPTPSSRRRRRPLDAQEVVRLHLSACHFGDPLEVRALGEAQSLEEPIDSGVVNADLDCEVLWRDFIAIEISG